MKIFFVGIHNKIGKQPLDSTTRTGKVIDEIIAHLQVFECVKTNFSEECDFPNHFENERYNKEWYEKHQPTKEDLIVTLGHFVKENLEKRETKIIRLNHPAGEFRRGTDKEYMKQSVVKIIEAI